MRTIIFVLALCAMQVANALSLEEEIEALMDTAEQFRVYNYPEPTEYPQVYLKKTHEPEWGQYEQLMQAISVRLDFIEQRYQQGLDRYLLVNRAQFVLRVVDDEQVVVMEKVIIGRKSRPTPLFDGEHAIQNIVLNPYWNVPYQGNTQSDVVTKIAKKESLEEQIAYIQHKGYRFFNGSGEVDPLTLDFENFPKGVKIRQDPGDLNSLGRIKFLFPNRHNTYLHDTPSKHLFNRHERNFSSGCIRVQNPLNLGEYLLGKTVDEIQTMIDNGSGEKWIRVSNPLPVFVVDGPGWDVWVDEDGTIRYSG